MSHQWLARDEPDPDGVHFAAICRAVRLVAAEWREAPKDMYLWVDFCCVPQANRNTQEMAIQSLPVFASACRYFVAVCPESTHESGAVVDVATRFRGADIPQTRRGDAAAATRIFRGPANVSRPRPGRVAAAATTRIVR